jgi:hypothetical protein
MAVCSVGKGLDPAHVKLGTIRTYGWLYQRPGVCMQLCATYKNATTARDRTHIAVMENTQHIEVNLAFIGYKLYI